MHTPPRAPPCPIPPNPLFIDPAAVGGGTAVRIVELGGSFGESRGDAMDLPHGELVSCLGWTQDGQVLSVGTQVSPPSALGGSLPASF